MALVPLQQVDPMRYKAWIESSQQPGATLNQTNMSAAAAGASAASSMESAQRTAQDIKIAQQKQQQQQFATDTQKLFDSNKNKDGYVDPALYNKVKQAATSIGIDSGSFDSSFGDNSGFVDPQKVIYYNSASGLANQQAFGQVKRQVQQILDQYNNLPSDQKGVFSKAEVAAYPILGQLLAPDVISYERNRTGLAAELKSLAGAGQGSGVRVNNTEFSKWADLLPKATDSSTTVSKSVQAINSGIKANWNTPQGLDPQYVPQNSNRPSLDSFWK